MQKFLKQKLMKLAKNRIFLMTRIINVLEKQFKFYKLNIKINMDKQMKI